MKYIKSILLCGICLAAFSLTSCSDWLDVNTDPENPSSNSATYQSRLAHIEFYTNHAQQIAAYRSNMITGDWIRNSGTYWSLSYWLPTASITTTAYQWWFVGACCNILDMYDKAVAAEAWHYAGVAKVIRAYGFMLMTDLYGEMPYTDAVGENATPYYDNGKTIYIGCLKELDEGIEYLQKDQNPSLPSLAVGDYWNSGDANKWLKFAYLLKARFCVKLNKKANGSYLDGKYDADAILDALAHGPQSNNDNTIIRHTDDNGATHDVLGWNEPVDYSPLYSVCGMNGGILATKVLYDNLTNFCGYGVEDPRADHILPWAISVKSSDTPKEIKWKGDWRRTLGVDMITENSPSISGGPLRASFDTKWFINTKNEFRLGDTIYIESTSSSKGYAKNVDLLYRRKAGVDASRESGSFYSRVSSPTYVGTYMEACFIKAEVLFNKGDANGAFDAYKTGIRASIELMNDQLKTWCDEDPSLEECPSFTPMVQSEIDNFLANGIGTAGNLTLGKILTQKRIAMLYSVELWNDMRRYDYDPNLFIGWDIPIKHSFEANALKAVPQGKTLRRWQQCSHERNYNSSNLAAIGAEVPGADTSLDQWNSADDVWTINVWWDSPQE